MQIPQDSYVTVAEADAYHNARPSQSVWAAFSQQEKEQRLVIASDYVDSAYTYKGKKTDENQPREFPRNGMTDTPIQVKRAVFELGLQSDLTANEAASIKREKVDVLEVEYFESQNTARFSYIESLLKPFILVQSSARFGAILINGGRHGCC